MQTSNSFEIKQKHTDELKILTKRWKGSYEDTGKIFPNLFRNAGRFRIKQGFCFNLYHDDEYKEIADIESCLSIKEAPEKKEKEWIQKGLDVRILSPQKCVSLIHKGPYQELKKSYQKIFNYLKEKELKHKIPIREIYIKGPGLIFKGNQKNYLTEIQIPI